MGYILAVDDSPSVRSMVEMTIEDTEHDIALASDGVEALELAKEDQFDLVITDINMPNMGGFELINQLRQLDSYRVTPILCLTTESSQEQMTKGKNAGASGWVVKPFSPTQLITQLDKLI